MKKFMKNAWAVLAVLLLMAVPCLSADYLSVSPDDIEVTGTRLSGASAVTFYVGNNSGATWTSQFTVAESTDMAWMSLTPATGTTTGDWISVTVTFVTTNLWPGIYTNKVLVSQTNATIQSKTVDFQLTITGDDNLGVNLGPSSAATAPSGIAIGDMNGRAVAIGSNTVQIGGGVNSTVGSVQIRSTQLLDSNNRMPISIMPTNGVSGTYTNDTDVAVTNISIVVSNGLVKTITINGK